MALIQKSVINKHVKALDKYMLKAAYERFRKFYTNQARLNNILQLKEENYQEGFLREVFVQVLGYTINPDPNFNLTTEFKNFTDARKADGAILLEGKAVAVIELKSTKTKDLESIKNQAFGYKINQPDCKYVITSNFQKLRLYIETTHDYQEFDLFNMPFEKFKQFYLLLCKDNLLKNLPEKLKNETKLPDVDITEKFYNDYKAFKDRLFDNLVKANPQYAQLTLFRKSQKLVDRILFILFAEDNGLIPPNTISKIITDWETLKKLNKYQPLYDIFKEYFIYLDKGFVFGDWGEIPAYNGGLFSHDELLDKQLLNIPDGLLQNHTPVLSAYDFSSDVDVNILGHIFEHSLNEIEEITAKLKGEELNRTDVKRKKDGIFYTPQYITQYIIESTVGELCTAKRRELNLENPSVSEIHFAQALVLSPEGTQLLSNLNTYKTWLLTLKIIDPACGSGAFLNQALVFLIEEHRIIDDLLVELTGNADIYANSDKSILEHNIFGVDINDESVDIAKLSLWLRTALPGRTLSDLSSNIKLGNSLIDDPEVAGDLAFNWHIQFADIMATGGFDVVVGNPPYGAELAHKDWLKKNYKETAFGTIDSYKFFVQRGTYLVKTQGVLSFIIPDSYLEKEYFKDLREFVSTNFEAVRNIKLGDNIFDEVNLPTAIIRLKNKGFATESFSFLDISAWQTERKHTMQLKAEVFNCTVPNFIESFIVKNSIINTKNTKRLIDLYEQVMGVKVYQQGKGKPKQTTIQKENNVFISNVKSKTFPYPFVSQGIYRYFYSDQNEFINYGEWLAEPRTENIFVQPKIVVREIINPRVFSTYIETPAVVKNIAAVIVAKNKKFDLKYLLALLNSKLISYYIYEQSPKSTNKSYPSFNSRLIKNIPIKLCKNQQPFIEKADLMLSLHNQFQAEKTNFLNTVKENTGIVKITGKLESINELDFAAFKKELLKQKIAFALGSETDQWRNYFNSTVEKINRISRQIAQTDAEIDAMVYQLYNLTAEEVAIIEGV